MPPDKVDAPVPEEVTLFVSPSWIRATSVASYCLKTISVPSSFVVMVFTNLETLFARF